MINQHFYIARLIARYLSDEIGEEEQAELTRWRDESPENERLFQEICKEENIKQNMQKRQTFHAEDGWEGVQRKIQRHRFRHRTVSYTHLRAHETDGRECKEKSNAIGSDIGY